MNTTADDTLAMMARLKRKEDTRWKRHKPFHYSFMSINQQRAYGLHNEYPDSATGVMFKVASYLADGDEDALEAMQKHAESWAHDDKPDADYLLITAALQAVRDMGYDLPDVGDKICVRLRNGDHVIGIVHALAKDGGQNIVLYEALSGNHWCLPQQIVRGQS